MASASSKSRALTSALEVCSPQSAAFNYDHPIARAETYAACRGLTGKIASDSHPCRRHTAILAAASSLWARGRGAHTLDYVKSRRHATPLFQ
jgi:hypothetical protein